MRFAQNAIATPASGIREIVHLVIESDSEVTRLEIGESAAPTPRHIVDSARDAALRGHTRYTSSAGVTELRGEICEKLRRVNGLTVAPGHVAVTTGAVEGLYLVLASLCDPGDEILLPDPGWPNYEMMGRLVGARCRLYPCSLDEGFVPSVAALRPLVTERTRALVVNSPSNPTGAVCPPDILEELVAFAKEHELVLLSDETYDELYFGEPPVSALRFVPDADRHVVSVFSFSKTYAMTGWRVGYIVGPEELVGMVTKLQEPVNSCAASISQQAALAALRGPQDWVVAQRDSLRNVRDALVDALDAERCTFHKPDGSFYLWLHLEGWSSRSFAQRLLAEEAISLAPGSAFGPHGEEYARICFAGLGDDASAVIRRVLGLVRRRDISDIALAGESGSGA